MIMQRYRNICPSNVDVGKWCTIWRTAPWFWHNFRWQNVTGSGNSGTETRSFSPTPLPVSVIMTSEDEGGGRGRGCTISHRRVVVTSALSYWSHWWQTSPDGCGGVLSNVRTLTWEAETYYVDLHSDICGGHLPHVTKISLFEFKFPWRTIYTSHKLEIRFLSLK